MSDKPQDQFIPTEGIESVEQFGTPTVLQPGVATERDEALALEIKGSDSHEELNTTTVEGRVAAHTTDDPTAAAVVQVDNGPSSSPGNLEARLTAGATLAATPSIVPSVRAPIGPSLPPAPQVIPGSAAPDAPAPGGAPIARVSRSLRAEPGKYGVAFSATGPSPLVGEKAPDSPTRQPVVAADAPEEPPKRRPASIFGPFTPLDAVPPALGQGTSDAPTSDDRLGFLLYVNAVATFLLKRATEPPFAMSIEAEWGAGKSSFLKQLGDELVRTRSPEADQVKSARVVRFSPWRHQKDESLWASFALQFVKDTKLQGFRKRCAASARLTWRQFDFAEGWPALLGFVISVLVCLAFAVVFLIRLFDPGLGGIGGAAASMESWIRYIATWAPPLLTSGVGLIGALFAGSKIAVRRLDTKLDRYIRRPDYANKLSFLTSDVAPCRNRTPKSKFGKGPRWRTTTMETNPATT